MLEGSHVSYTGYAFLVSTRTVLYATLGISTLLPEFHARFIDQGKVAVKRLPFCHSNSAHDSVW
jgi:hypothetical protein